MAAHDFAEFSWDEQEDVKAILASQGLELREFRITDNIAGNIADNGKHEAGGKNGAIRQISITRIGNGKTAIYDTDHFAPWISDFEQALQAGDFDD